MVSPPKNPSLSAILDRFYSRIAIAVAAALVAFGLGIFASIKLDDWTWFSRSGSIAVVVGLWLVSWDLRNKVRSESLEFAEPLIVAEYAKRGASSPTAQQIGDVKELLRESMMSVVRPQFSRTELGIVSIGTIIWGFGDLLNCVFGST